MLSDRFRVAIDVGCTALEFIDFLKPVVRNLFLRLLFLACDNWLFPGVLLEFFTLVSELCEIFHNLLCRLTIVQSYLNSTSSLTDTSEIVLINGSTDDMLAATYTLQVLSVEVLRQIRKN